MIIFPLELREMAKLTPERMATPCFAVVASGRGRSPQRKGLPLTSIRPNANFGSEVWNGSRLAYHLNVARIPRCPPSRKDGLVLHHCDNGWCVNPDHLYSGTCKQNIKDLFDRNQTIRAKISASRRASRASDATRAKMSAARRGFRFSEAVKAKISQSALRSWAARKEQSCA